jgi:hypothetical protein
MKYLALALAFTTIYVTLTNVAGSAIVGRAEVGTNRGNAFPHRSRVIAHSEPTRMCNQWLLL